MSFEKTPLYIYKSGQGGDGAFLDKVSVLDAYETLSYTHGHYAPGNFELSLNANTSRASDLQVGRIIRIGEDDTKSVIINTIRKSMDKTGNVLMMVSGREAWSIFDRRSVAPPSFSANFTTTSTTPVETGVKTVIEQNIGASAIASRQVAQINVVATAGGGSNYAFSERYSSLLDAVSKALLQTNSGLTVTLNQNTLKWDIDWTAGTDRTATVVLSSKFNTAQNATVQESDSAYKNVIIAAGQGEGVDRNIRVGYSGMSEPAGIDRREVFRDMRDLSLNASIDARSAQVLSEQSYTKTIEVSPLAYSRVVYGRDYFVGDKITFDELGTVQEAWITSATEQWKAGSYELKLGIDKAPANITGQVVSLANANGYNGANIEKRSTDGVIIEHKTTISKDCTISTGSTGLSYSPVLISDGVTVKIPVGSTWRIVA